MPLTQPETQTELPEQVSSGQISLSIWTHNIRMRIIGVYAIHILLEMEGELVIIDQHAAHERILFVITDKTIKKKNAQSIIIETT